jgi:hypothetical protein
LDVVTIGVVAAADVDVQTLRVRITTEFAKVGLSDPRVDIETLHDSRQVWSRWLRDFPRTD